MNDSTIRQEAADTLVQYAGMIEDSLSACFPVFPAPESRILEAMKYSLLSGGKRIRGALVLAFYRLFHENPEPALPFACALEMIHAYSLIHDDLPCMDDDDLRRGKPACHIAYGEALALLAGDALLTQAFETMTQRAVVRQFPPDAILTAVRTLASAAGIWGMVTGQVIDLAMDAAGPSRGLPVLEADPDEEYDRDLFQESLLIRMYQKKTCTLIDAAVRIGCILAGAEDSVLFTASHFANQLGLAFQIVDDILDVTGDEASLGKSPGSDAAKGKFTYVSAFGLEPALEQAKRYHKEAGEALDQLPGDTRFLRGLVEILTDRQS